MHMIRALNGDTLEEQMHPSFRKIQFSDESAIVTVSTLLRAAWLAPPPSTTPTAQTLGQWMTAYSKKSPEDQATFPKNPDTSTLNTPWRVLVCEMFNHVFYDVHNWLREACMLVSEFVTPAHKTFSLPFPSTPSSSKAASAELEKTWDVSVFLIPAYLAPGFTVRAYRLEDRYGKYEEEGGKELDKFCFEGGDEQGRFDAWYLMPGTRVRFTVEVAKDGMKGEGVAAVMVVGEFTKAEEKVGEEKDGDGDDEGEGRQHSEGEDREERQAEPWMGLAA